MGECVSRKIIHIDMDCFYAAVEMRDNPSLRNKPLAVGGAARRRGVLCTCNYLAREYGCRSAMPSHQALKLCPDLIIVPPNISHYKSVSYAIQQIFQQYTDNIEPLSLDEAYLDVSDCQQHQGSATWIASAIRQQIFEQQAITASAGVAPNKYLAKIASDWRKPNGQYVIPPHAVDEFVHQLPVKKLFGVGKVTADKLQLMGITTCRDLQQVELSRLINAFGKMGARLYELARGQDDRPVQAERQRKSVSVEHTYEHDLPDLIHCQQQLPRLLSELQHRLHAQQVTAIHKQFVKIKFFDFSQTTVECLSTELLDTIYSHLLSEAFHRGDKPVRLLGLGVRLNQQDEDQQQLSFELA